MSAEGREPTEEELRTALDEQLRNFRVEDVILQTTATLINLGGRRLGLADEPGKDPSAEVDLQQAKLAIDGARALSPLCPAEHAEPIRQVLSQLQIAFARLTQAPGGAGVEGAPSGPVPGGDVGGTDQEADQGDEDAEQADARSKLWTPPGA